MKRLILLRHAKAERHVDVAADRSRPLAPRGLEQAAALGRRWRGEALDVVLVSGAKRTRQTWDQIARQLDTPPREVERLSELYLASVADVLDLIRGVDETAETCVIVGHEPTMSSLAAHLAGPGSVESALHQVRAGLSTANYAELVADLSWAGWGRGCARLVAIGRSEGR
ncbi:MAG: histidine phosphatase family protein [Promicromonosporaceae bacterium]|nr:histidine phosphatase family protein [Promicromonosporaceae bacterium]